MIQEKKKGMDIRVKYLRRREGFFSQRQRLGPGLQQEEELPALCTCRGVCRSGGGKMRNFPLVPSVFSEKGDEVIS